IFVIGLTRVRVSEVESERLYRKVEIAPLKEKPVPNDEAERLRRDLELAIKARSPTVTLPADVPLGQLADLLLLHLKLDVSTMIDLYSRLDVLERARGALDQHLKLPYTTPPKVVETPGGELSPRPEDANPRESSGETPNPGEPPASPPPA